MLDSDELSCQFDCGVNKPSVAYHITDEQNIFHLFYLHFIILQRKAEIDRLFEGLNDLGFLQFLKRHPDAAHSLLVSGSQKLTAASLEQLFFFSVHDSAVALPTINTCSSTLTLPTAIANGDTFKKRMTYAIFNSVGFGHV